MIEVYYMQRDTGITLIWQYVRRKTRAELLSIKQMSETNNVERAGESEKVRTSFPLKQKQPNNFTQPRWIVETDCKESNVWKWSVIFKSATQLSNHYFADSTTTGPVKIDIRTFDQKSSRGFSWWGIRCAESWPRSTFGLWCIISCKI